MMCLFVQYTILIFVYCLLTRRSFSLPLSDTELKNEIRLERSKRALELIQKSNCVDLGSTTDCETSLKKKHQSQMHIYIAERNSDTTKLTVRPIHENKEDFEKLDGVVVIDPQPKALYGHTLIVMMIKTELPANACKWKKGIYYKPTNNMNSECIYVPNQQLCLALLSRRDRKMLKRTNPCAFNFFPKVYDAETYTGTKLKCYSNLNGFGTCPILDSKNMQLCLNDFHCGDVTAKLSPNCAETCDHAVMISGGWNQFVNQKRHYENMHAMWKYLTKRGYRPGNIGVFFANNATIDLDKNPKTAETFPAFSSSKIIRHLKYICERKHRCVDTITVYLNGPTFLNGDILLWDRNRDGRATDMEVLTIDELLAPFGNCGARNVLLLADQNYAGNIVNRVRKLRNKSSQYNNVHVVTASSKKSLSYERTFTEEFIKRDNVWIDDRSATAQARQINHIFKDMETALPNFNLQYLPGSNAKNFTITGSFGQKAGCTPNLKHMLSRIGTG